MKKSGHTKMGRSWRNLSASALTVEVRPLSGLDEAGPVEGMLAALALQHLELRDTQRVPSPEARAQARVVRHHRFAGDRVAHRPQAHHDGFRAREHERT